VLRTRTKNTLPVVGYFTVARRSYGFYIEGSGHEIDSDTIDDFERSQKYDSIHILFSRWPGNDQRISGQDHSTMGFEDGQGD
jgi:hypothetical protein